MVLLPPSSLRDGAARLWDQLSSGSSYNYSNLVLALGSITDYSGVEGARDYTLPLRTAEDALTIDNKLRSCLQQAREISEPEQRRRLLTVAVVGGGPSGVEISCSLADLLPIGIQHWEVIRKRSESY